jgi:hypothetical protein
LNKNNGHVSFPEDVMPRSLRDGLPQAEQSPVSSAPRRRFLLALGATGAGAAAAAAAPAVGAVAAPAAEAAPASRGYQVTDHVRDYYDSTRL